MRWRFFMREAAVFDEMDTSVKNTIITVLGSIIVAIITSIVAPLVLASWQGGDGDGGMSNPVSGGIDQPSCSATMHTGLAQGNYTFEGGYHVVKLWRSNGDTPWGKRKVTAVVTGRLRIVQAGGDVWSYEDDCGAMAEQESFMFTGGAVKVSEAELREAGMIK